MDSKEISSEQVIESKLEELISNKDNNHDNIEHFGSNNDIETITCEQEKDKIDNLKINTLNNQIRQAQIKNFNKTINNNQTKNKLEKTNNNNEK